MKRLSISVALLLFACPAWGAAALQFEFATKKTQQTFTSATYANYLTVNITPSSTGDFIIIAHVAVGPNTVNNDQSAARLRKTSGTAATYFEHANTVLKPANSGDSFVMIAEVNLDTSTHTIAIQVARETGTGDINAESATIIILEKTSEMQVAELTTPFSTGNNADYQTALDLSFTSVARTVDYLVLFAANCESTDESVAAINGTKFVRDDNDDGTEDETYGREDEANAVTSSSGDNRTFAVSAVGVSNVASATAVHFQHRLDGFNDNDHAIANRSTIVAIPSDLFENFYFLDGGESKIFLPAGTAFETALSTTETINAAKHIILGSAEISNERGNNTTILGLDDGALVAESRQMDDRDEDNQEYWLSSIFHAENYGAGSRTFELQGKSDAGGSGDQAVFKRHWLIIAEIPGAAPPAARRRLNFVVGGSE